MRVQPPRRTNCPAGGKGGDGRMPDPCRKVSLLTKPTKGGLLN